VSSLLFGIGLLVVLVGLYLWARRRAEAIRHQAAQREQAAMAMMLGSSAPEAKASKAPAAPVEEIDHAALIRQAHGEAAEQDQASKDLPPIEYDRKLPGSPRNMTPAEEAAAGLDPIEELISQIMVDDSGRRAAPARVSAPPPPEPKRANAASRAAARELRVLRCRAARPG
jgi:hypothetical protein